MIRRTLAATQAATFSIDLPDARLQGMPCPAGTGFFVSPDGWFVTAAHVVTTNNQPDGPQRTDIGQAWLIQELRPDSPGGMCQFARLEVVDAATDLALLKVDFAKNANKEWLKGHTAFPFLQVSSRQLAEGEPVYAFGYPLSEAALVNDASPGVITFGHPSHCPRTTGAIVASTFDRTTMVMSPGDPQVYVLDKALNYGNSGGPIVATETGNVAAWCSRFQPLAVTQEHLKDKAGKPIHIWMPSLYGIVSSLRTPSVLAALSERGIPLVAD